MFPPFSATTFCCSVVKQTGNLTYHTPLANLFHSYPSCSSFTMASSDPCLLILYYSSFINPLHISIPSQNIFLNSLINQSITLPLMGASSPNSVNFFILYTHFLACPFLLLSHLILHIHIATVVGNHCFSYKAINSGVPHGSSGWSPTFYLLIQDFLSCTSSSIYSCTDDSPVHFSLPGLIL